MALIFRVFPNVSCNLSFTCSACSSQQTSILKLEVRGSAKSAAESWKSRNHKTVQYYLNTLVQLKATAHRNPSVHLVFITS